MTQQELLECVLCHRIDPEVAMALLAFEDGGKRYYGTDPRCRNHRACRDRVLASGEEWPLAPDLVARVG